MSKVRSLFFFLIAIFAFKASCLCCCALAHENVKNRLERLLFNISMMQKELCAMRVEKAEADFIDAERIKLQDKYYQKKRERRAGNLNPIGYEFVDKSLIACTVPLKRKKSVHCSNKKKKILNRLHRKRTVTSAQTQEFLDTVALSHKELMYEALYNNHFGFYSSGKIILGRDRTNVSFITGPEIMSPGYGAMIAFNAYAMYRSMILAGDLKDDDTFYIVELGAGNGTLARDLLDFIKNCADEETTYGYATHWQDFYSAVRYIIGELSPALAKKQREKNEHHRVSSKLKVVEIDARGVSALFGDKKINGLFFSNELPDVFPAHKVIANDNDYNVVVSIVTCAKKDLRVVFPQETDAHYIEHQSNEIRKKYMDELPQAIAYDSVIIPKRDYLAAKELAADQGRSIDNVITFYEKEVSMSYFQHLYAYIRRNSEYFLDGRRGPIYYIIDGIEPWLRSIASVLDRGFIITIDYGFSTSALDIYAACTEQTARTVATARLEPENVFFFPEGSTDSIYKSPGDYDITTDINFSDLSMLGEYLSLETILYGGQNCLIGKPVIADAIAIKPFEIDTDSLIFKDAEYIPSEELKRGSESSNFKVIIQKTKNTRSCFGILAEQEML